MHLQFTRSVVGILDGISDWPEDVVQEQSSAYVYNNINRNMLAVKIVEKHS